MCMANIKWLFTRINCSSHTHTHTYSFICELVYSSSWHTNLTAIYHFQHLRKALHTCSYWGPNICSCAASSLLYFMYASNYSTYNHIWGILFAESCNLNCESYNPNKLAFIWEIFGQPIYLRFQSFSVSKYLLDNVISCSFSIKSIYLQHYQCYMYVTYVGFT